MGETQKIVQKSIGLTDDEWEMVKQVSEKNNTVAIRRMLLDYSFLNLIRASFPKIDEIYLGYLKYAKDKIIQERISEIENVEDANKILAWIKSKNAEIEFSKELLKYDNDRGKVYVDPEHLRDFYFENAKKIVAEDKINLDEEDE